MHRSKRKRNIIIFSLVGVLLCMAIGYAAFQTQLKVTGTSKVTSNWDIEITNVTEGTPTGSAENTVAPSYDKLWASMEANLYDKGDAMEYDVTIENKGTLDAKLNDIITNLENSNSDAVIITFSGYTKGEVLKSKATKVIHVKIEYNPEYEGGETSSEVEINFDYTQNNNEENNPDSQYLLTYDYSTNGGQSVELTEELISSGSNVDLSNTATKEGWKFVGWNTDKDAEVGLKLYQMPTGNTTLYAIYSKTLKVTYEKDDNVESIGKTEDSCNIYNNGTSCEITLPEITVNDDTATVGWYKDNENIGNPNDKYTITNDITLRAKAEFEPIIQSWNYNASTDFHAEEYKTNIITATFLDNKNAPENAVISWDVSANQNGSVMAWVIPDESDSSKYHLYIGGNSGVIANADSRSIFRDFSNLQEITFGNNFDTSNVTDMGSMFFGCNNLTTLDVISLDTSKVKDMSYMFYNCQSLTELNVNNFNTSNVTDMSYMFYNCESLTELNVSNFNTNKVTDMDSMFRNCSNLTELNVNNFNTSNVYYMGSMFSGCSGLTELNVSNFVTSKVITMNAMFDGCESLTKLDVSNFNTSRVTNMQMMFRDCSSLAELDLRNFDTSKVVYMREMFRDCSSLTKLDVSGWITSKVTTMNSIFYNCSSLTQLDLSDWNTSQVTAMNSMFYKCRSLTELDLSNFDTSNVTNMGAMFETCTSLVKLKLCSFDTSNVTSMSEMFRSTSRLKTVYVGPSWTTENATTTDMFQFSGISEVTQSDNCEYDAEEISLDISTTSTTNSITVVANAYADSGIAKYEYSKDGGKTWEESTSNTYTFTGLTAGTSYDIKVRVTSNIGKTLEKGTNIDLDSLVSTNTDELYTDEHGDIRYYGANPNNYVSFNNELWRIIGVIDGKIKIIRNESIGTMQWNSSSTNNWNDSSLKTYLNGDYYNSIEPTSKGMISEETYYLGGATSSNYQTLTASSYYNSERDGSQVYSGNPASTTQHIGLMYPSDYGYAAGSSCLSTALYNYASSCKNSDYLSIEGVANKLQSPYASHGSMAANLTGSGYVTGYGGYVTIAGAVRPVLYLNTDVQIIRGDGSQNNPYQLGNGISTSTLEKPIFKEADTDNGKTVTITYPSGCGDSLTCTYQKDNGETVNVTSSTVNVEFTKSGSVVANVSDGTNNVSSSYTIMIDTTPPVINNIVAEGRREGSGQGIININVDAIDEESDIIKYEYMVDRITVDWIDAGKNYEYEIPYSNSGGSYMVYVRVTNAYGLSAIAETSVALPNVIEFNPPTPPTPSSS